MVTASIFPRFRSAAAPRGGWPALAACVAIGQLVVAPSAGAAKQQGLLVLTGGAGARIAVDRSTCTAGPGNAVAIFVTGVGGWGSLYFNASTPRPGRRGTTQVFLQGTGYRANGDAVDYWGWSEKTAARVASRGSVVIAAGGRSGVIETTLPVVGNDNAPRTVPVRVVLRWTPGMCVATP